MLIYPHLKYLGKVSDHEAIRWIVSLHGYVMKAWGVPLTAATFIYEIEGIP